MLPVFCVRLAAGMTACLLLLSPRASAGERLVVNPRFFRTHFLTALALACLALLFARSSADWLTLSALGAGAALCFAGSVSWSLEGAPGGPALIVLTLLALLAALVLLEPAGVPGQPAALAVAGGLTSAGLLGSAVSAMLMGHSYLIAPSMSMGPLMRLLAAVAVTLGARMAADGLALAFWTSGHSFGNLTGDAALWLPVRWLAGFACPLVLTWMAWQAARIRSTQSATGILYVVVIFCFLGELTGLLLRGTGVTL